MEKGSDYIMEEDEVFCVIDYDEFQAARRDPKVKAFIEQVEKYKQYLIENGHCPRCLVVNCEHMEDKNVSL